MKRNNEYVLLYNITPDSRLQAIKSMLTRLQIPFRIVTDEETQHPIGYLISAPGYAPAPDAVPAALPDELMLMKGFTNRRLDELLTSFRRNHIASVPLKAVVTDTNIRWTLQQLFVQLNLEHAQMLAYKNKH